MSKVTFTHKSIAQHRALADAIKDNCESTVTGTTATIKEKVAHAAYDANLPEGITPALIKDLSTYHSNFSKSQHVAMSELGAEIFNANSDCNIIQSTVGVFAHGDTSEMTIERSHSFPNLKAKEGEPSHTLSHLYIKESTTYKDSSFKAMKKAISAEFKDKYVN